MRREAPAVAAMGLLLVASILLGMLTSSILPPEYRVFGENTGAAENSIYVFGIVLVFTAVILAIARWGRARLIQVIILGSVALSVFYVSYPPLLLTGLGSIVLGGAVDAALVSAAAIGALAVALLYRYPEWYVVDAAGVVMAGGVAAIFGISLETSVVIILLIIFAIYDYISVHQTRHMIALADSVMDLRLPVLMVVPKRLPYSFLRERRLRLQLEEGSEREAMFMGLGDIVFPGMLVVSSLVFLRGDPSTALGLHGNIAVALGTLVGCVAGFLVLMHYVLKGNPQPGLPLLNGGAISGYLVSALLVYGDLGLTLPSFGG
ncbi:MAG: presenilin family intramembrane aspartyl protease PSH [Thermoplasmatota archaeon]